MKVLYVTYDGICDPLGQSQILPYIFGLNDLGVKYTILSVEKYSAYKNLGTVISIKIKNRGIDWHKVKFHHGFMALSKFLDILSIYIQFRKLVKYHKYDLVHCRSYIPAVFALFFKRKYGFKMLFDMRGFWPDEKVEGGSWNLDKTMWRITYNFFKSMERRLLDKSDYVVTLTNRGKSVIQDSNDLSSTIPITVIPCCVDDRLFSLTNSETRNKSRQLLRIPEDAFVLGYLGSLGSWYLLDEMVEFYLRIEFEDNRKKYFFLLTNTLVNQFEQYMVNIGLTKNELRIQSVSHSLVSSTFKAVDIGICFIKDVPSKRGSSPTKIGEILSMGIPMIINDVGDNSDIAEVCEGVAVVNLNKEKRRCDSKDIVKMLEQVDSRIIREQSLRMFQLSNGIRSYKNIYDRAV